MMRLRLPLHLAALAYVLSAVVCLQITPAVSPVQCTTDTGTPAFLRAVAANNVVTSFVSKLFQCIEETISAILDVVKTLVSDVMSCITSSPAELLRCLARLDVPSKVGDVINAVMTTLKCVTSK